MDLCQFTTGYKLTVFPNLDSYECYNLEFRLQHRYKVCHQIVGRVSCMFVHAPEIRPRTSVYTVSNQPSPNNLRQL